MVRFTPRSLSSSWSRPPTELQGQCARGRKKNSSHNLEENEGRPARRQKLTATNVPRKHSLIPYDRSIASEERVPHIVRRCASSFSLRYPLSSLKSSSGCLHLFPRLPITYILPSIFPPITYFRRHFLDQMWPMQVAYPLFTLCRIFLRGGAVA